MSKFQEKLIKDYEQKGYDVIKTIRLNKQGYPDLFLFKDGKAFFIEAKESNDILSELQKLRINQLIKNGFDSIDKLISAAKKNNTAIFSKIEGFGETTAELLIDHFTDDRNLRLIEHLRGIGLNFQEQDIKIESNMEKIFHNQVWVITGTFDKYKPRLKAVEEIEKRGGMVSDIISSKVTHILVGLTPGSKLEKAREFPIKLVTESQFLEMTKKK